MASGDLRDQLVNHLQEAYALEQNILRVLDGLAGLHDGETRALLDRFRTRAEYHLGCLRNRLRSLGRGTGLAAELPATAPDWLKCLVGLLKGNRPGDDPTDFPGAGQPWDGTLYGSVARLAEGMGDPGTARLAGDIRRGEEELARWLARRWPAFARRPLGDADSYYLRVSLLGR
jgi:ferritin-like metal-binding protein YciE